MDSKQILEFLNRDSLEGSKKDILEGSKIQDNQDTTINVENKINNMNSAEILQFLNTDDLSNRKNAATNAVAVKGKTTAENKEVDSWVSTIRQNGSNKGRGL